MLTAPRVNSMELLRRYDTEGPRYTSYPTVPAWSNAFGHPDFASALRATGEAGAPLELYVHCPYCAAKCFYCGCNALTTSRPELIDQYLDDLETEIETVTQSLGKGKDVIQLHWGGGTPNHLDERQLQRAFGMLASHFTFLPNAELSVEADPRLVSREQLRTLYALGFRRLSFGVQDLDPQVQEAIGRVQSFAMVQDVVAAAREAGFEAINLDLIYGLPRQTQESFGRTIQQVLTLAPDRVACFGYAHMPAQRPHQRLIEQDDLPDGSARFALLRQAVSAFTSADYAWIGLDHFARADDPLAVAQRNGVLHRNFMGYTTRAGQHLLGLGMSAISEIEGTFAQNASALPEWRSSIRSGRLATVRGHTLSDDDRARQAAILRIMCDLELRIEEIPRGIEDLDARLAPFVADGLVVQHVDRIEVTALGRYFLRNICAVFDAYLPAQRAAGRFSRTI
ncbi:MAG: oxygen-independent coproporphyrinogen III oxidase [Gemmatimonadaceae bacterium]|nr:oxygen-independent coproporphyrinogen III oxidase [Gemmatimonadaceae bacterium]